MEAGRRANQQRHRAGKDVAVKTRHVRRTHGVALLDCIVYLTLLAVIFGFAVAAFLETVSRSTELDYIATSTVQALHAGEQWREDVRQAQAPPQSVVVDGRAELHIRTASGVTSYAVQDSVLRRRTSETAPWAEVLSRVKSSRFSEDRRKHVTAWRWELELETRQDREKSSRVLTFQAVPLQPKP